MSKGTQKPHGIDAEPRPLVDPERGPALRRWVQAKRRRYIYRAIDLEVVTVEQGRELERLWNAMDDE